MSTRIRTIARDESGAALAEYGLLIALIAAVCIAIVKLIGGKINAGFDNLNTNLP